jgi:hypothetical protein
MSDVRKKSSPKSPLIEPPDLPLSQQRFVNAALTDHNFRMALINATGTTSNDQAWKDMSAQLISNKIFTDPNDTHLAASLATIASIDWKPIHDMELSLGRGAEPVVGPGGHWPFVG